MLLCCVLSTRLPIPAFLPLTFHFSFFFSLTIQPFQLTFLVVQTILPIQTNLFQVTKLNNYLGLLREAFFNKNIFFLFWQRQPLKLKKVLTKNFKSKMRNGMLCHSLATLEGEDEFLDFSRALLPLEGSSIYMCNSIPMNWHELA